MDVLEIQSIAELRENSEQWDALWRRSDVSHPTARAELLALWMHQFAPEAGFRAVVVKEQGQFLAALPLCNSTLGGITRAALPGNDWSPGGELLVDQTTDAAAALRRLANHLAEADFSMLWFDGVRTETPSLRQLMVALGQRGFSLEEQHRCDVGMLEIPHDWEKYVQTLSRNHRQNMRRSERQLAEQGRLALRVLSSLNDADVEPEMRTGFDVEHRSWKGAAGSSALATPGMFDFFVQQARQANQWGQLTLAYLELDGLAIAFEYGWTAKGVNHSFKVGYDAAFAKHSPGQLLMGKLIEHFSADRSVHTIDCLGPISGAVAKWRPDSASVSRLIAARPGLRGKALLQGYKTARACVRQSRQWKTWLQETLRPPTGGAQSRAT